MTSPLFSLDCNDLNALDNEQKQQALTALETGRVVYFPHYSFSQEKDIPQELLSPAILDGKHKNVSFNYQNSKLGGMRRKNKDLATALRSLMHGYALFAKDCIDQLFPFYSQSLHFGRTSYRPAEIKGRARSKRQDDTRVHVDAFASSPVYGQRILRVFCNINPYNQPRVWHLGEPFEQVMRHFAASLPPYSLRKAQFLQLIKATKTLRSAYDHYQLHLHDAMKLDDTYQQTVNKLRVEFPPFSTWIVFTDQVSHAALGGQFLLEQTFYLPIEGMVNPELSPLRQWEKQHRAVLV